MQSVVNGMDVVVEVTLTRPAVYGAETKLSAFVLAECRGSRGLFGGVLLQLARLGPYTAVR